MWHKCVTPLPLAVSALLVGVAACAGRTPAGEPAPSEIQFPLLDAAFDALVGRVDVSTAADQGLSPCLLPIGRGRHGADSLPEQWLQRVTRHAKLDVCTPTTLRGDTGVLVLYLSVPPEHLRGVVVPGDPERPLGAIVEVGAYTPALPESHPSPQQAWLLVFEWAPREWRLIVAKPLSDQ